MTTLRSSASGLSSHSDFNAEQTGKSIRTSVTILLVALVLLLAIRRLSGAISEPLPVSVYLLLGFMFAATAVLLRKSLLAFDPTWTCIGGTVIAIIGALSVSLSQSPIAGLLVMWLAIALEEGWAWRQWFERGSLKLTEPIAEPPVQPIVTAGSPQGVADNTDDIQTNSTITQQLVRRRQPDGTESISGYLRADFEPGQRTAILHVSFCPPLDASPNCAAEPSDGPAAQIRITQVLPQGARLEAKLDSTAEEPQQLLIEFSAFESEAIESAVAKDFLTA
jgi:hypothetical protein